MVSEARQPTLKERQRSEREELILQAAHQLLLERGLRDTSLDDIAERVGIAKGTIYLHFSSKEELVTAILERGIRCLMETLDKIFASPGTPREKLEAVIKQMYESMNGGRPQLVTSLMGNPEFHAHMAAWHKAKREYWTEPRRRVAALFDEGRARGDFDRAIPTPVLVSIFWSMLSPQTNRRLIEEEHMPVNKVAQYVSQVFFQGITARKE